MSTQAKTLKLGVLSIGTVNIQTGKTKYDWSIYDNGPGHVFLANDKLIYAQKDSLKVGDVVKLINHDTHRSVRWADGLTVVDEAPAERDAVVEMLLRNEFDYRKLRPFQKKKFSRKLSTSFSLKTINYELYNDK